MSILDTRCPTCQAPIGQHCRNTATGEPIDTWHLARVETHRYNQRPRATHAPRDDFEGMTMPEALHEALVMSGSVWVDEENTVVIGEPRIERPEPPVIPERETIAEHYHRLFGIKEAQQSEQEPHNLFNDPLTWETANEIHRQRGYRGPLHQPYTHYHPCACLHEAVDLVRIWYSIEQANGKPLEDSIPDRVREYLTEPSPTWWTELPSWPEEKS